MSVPKNSDALIRQVIDADADISETLSSDSLLGVEHHFALFKKKYSKSYANEEEHAFRFKVFQRNLKRARRHQRFDPSAIHDVTQFSNLTHSEFKRTVLRLRGSRRLKLPTDANTAPILPTEDYRVVKY
ncbi:putative cysteine protease RD19C [Castanea sativa]|uniref:putative cysteine protease RD19C n=1 Tax=Castanea sativa TaxID=21020 RepID=UPI003F64EAE0